MSDPKATKMTLREAVEIDRLAHIHEGGVRRNGRDYEPTNDEDRARAIVDAAVKAHEARDEVRRVASGLQDGDLRCEIGRQEFEALCKADEDEFKKLRALERGESEGQP